MRLSKTKNKEKMIKCIITLSKLNIFKKACIKRIVAEPEKKLRLSELGLVRGTEVSVKKRSPFFYPLAIEVRGYELCLGKAECEKIFVEVKS